MNRTPELHCSPDQTPAMRRQPAPRTCLTCWVTWAVYWESGGGVWSKVKATRHCNRLMVKHVKGEAQKDGRGGGGRHGGSGDAGFLKVGKSI